MTRVVGMEVMTTADAPRNIRWVLHVMGDPSLSSRSKAAAAVLGLKYMDWRTLGNGRPGPARLSGDLGCSLSTAKRALLELTEAGHVVKTHKGGKRRGMRTATSYKGVFRPYTPVTPGHDETPTA